MPTRTKAIKPAAKRETMAEPTSTAPVAIENNAGPAQTNAEQTDAQGTPKRLESTTGDRATPEATRNNIKPAKSTVEHPTKLVWIVADEMRKANPQATRRQIVDECIRRGVAYYTARSQVQRFLAQASRPTHTATGSAFRK
jgi:hypothetical protein